MRRSMSPMMRRRVVTGAVLFVVILGVWYVGDAGYIDREKALLIAQAIALFGIFACLAMYFSPTESTEPICEYKENEGDWQPSEKLLELRNAGDPKEFFRKLDRMRFTGGFGRAELVRTVLILGCVIGFLTFVMVTNGIPLIWLALLVILPTILYRCLWLIRDRERNLLLTGDIVRGQVMQEHRLVKNDAPCWKLDVYYEIDGHPFRRLSKALNVGGAKRGDFVTLIVDSKNPKRFLIWEAFQF